MKENLSTKNNDMKKKNWSDFYLTEDEIKRYARDSKRALRSRLYRKYPILGTFKVSDLLVGIGLTPLTAQMV